jgi:hypothetical protein
MSSKDSLCIIELQIGTVDFLSSTSDLMVLTKQSAPRSKLTVLCSTGPRVGFHLKESSRTDEQHCIVTLLVIVLLRERQTPRPRMYVVIAFRD